MRKMPLTLAAAALAAVGALALAGSAFGDDDDYGHGERRAWSEMSRGVAPVTNEQYRNECAACHMAYPAGLLPARSWERMMGGLEDHFGENAELPAATRDTILKYLTDNAADRVAWRRSAKFDRSIPADEAPLRISQTSYFVRKHDEIPEARMVTGNPQVKSWANCAACHQGAEQGDFEEHAVRIPGFGRFED